MFDNKWSLKCGHWRERESINSNSTRIHIHVGLRSISWNGYGIFVSLQIVIFISNSQLNFIQSRLVHGRRIRSLVLYQKTLGHSRQTSNWWCRMHVFCTMHIIKFYHDILTYTNFFVCHSTVWFCFGKNYRAYLNSSSILLLYVYKILKPNSAIRICCNCCWCWYHRRAVHIFFGAPTFLSMPIYFVYSAALVEQISGDTITLWKVVKQHQIVLLNPFSNPYNSMRGSCLRQILK